ncbi:hypothetical protein BVY04_02420 [bacterium M21]|nr:hypothetical protein BVY04_02420 [bacterium M21]
MKKANTVLALFTLVSGLLTAFSLACMVYTFMTGELPFDISPLIPKVEAHNKEVDPEKQEKEEKNNELRDAEDTVLALHANLKSELSGLSTRKEELDKREKTVDEKIKNIRRLQETVRGESEEIISKLETIDEQEMENIKELAKLLSEIEPKAGAQMLLTWESEPEFNKSGRLAPRVLYFMTSQKAAEILNTILKEGVDAKVRQASEIADAMRKLTPGVKRKK